jgi:beta-galactosidase/beta-glucuronidase
MNNKVLSAVGKLVGFCLLGLVTSCQSYNPVPVSLAGDWAVCLDSTGLKEINQLQFNLTAKLPGTLDEAGIGKRNSMPPELKRETMLHLQRKFDYVGKVWYRKTISVPVFAKPSRAILNLERVLWKSMVYVNKKQVGEANSLSVPHRYDITEFIVPGKENEILICVDNSRQYVLNKSDMAHAYTNETQIKWNGVLGDFSIAFVPSPEMNGIQLFPNLKEQTLTIKIDGSFGSGSEIKFALMDKNGALVAESTQTPNASGIFLLKLPNGIKNWDEFSPTLYSLETSLVSNGKTIQQQIDTIGFRTIEASGKRLLVNGTPMFLRGTLECSIFPLTGHPPVSVEEWTKLYKSAKAYGLNHIRFHSWCPPKAAFEAADRLGIYLQIEAPNWNTTFGADPASAEFIETEAIRIVQTYGNHPRFASCRSVMNCKVILNG